MAKTLPVALLIPMLAALALAQPPTDQLPGQPFDESITSKIDRVLAQWKPDAVGCALGVMKDGKLIYTRCLGMADLEHGAPITGHSALDIASISKQFTAMAILLLVQQGKIALDDDVRKYVPEVPDYGV